MSVEHGTVTHAHDYVHPPERVFAAWADAEVKQRWFSFDDGSDSEWSSDFRVGGVERFASPPGTQPAVVYEARFSDIVPDRRIVQVSEISVDGRRASVTVATVEFTATETGTRLTITDSGAYLDGLDSPGDRRSGAGRQLLALDDYLEETS